MEEQQQPAAPAEAKAKKKRKVEAEAAQAVEPAPAPSEPEQPAAPADATSGPVYVMTTRVKFQGQHWEPGAVVKPGPVLEHFLLHGFVAEQVGG